MARRESDATETMLEGLTPLRPSLRRKKKKKKKGKCSKSVRVGEFRKETDLLFISGENK